ncbi:MAG: phosphotransferase [Actinobacteria bacterium]|nr:phosphotransferase [Actinomycetota bacterium]
MRYASTSDFGYADLHIHSRFSDGVSSIKRILDHVEWQTSIDVIAITDHNTIKGSALAASLQDRYSFEIVVGEEISTRSGEIIGLFLTDEIERGLSVEKTIDLIHEQGGLAIAPHPFALSISVIGGVGIGFKNVRSLDLDGFEELNANPTTWYSNLLSKWLIRPLGGLARLGGSDAHTARSIGAAATAFKGKTAADLRHSIEMHETTPIKISSWFKQLLVSAGVIPGMALQARKFRNGTAEKSAVRAFFNEQLTKAVQGLGEAFGSNER